MARTGLFATLDTEIENELGLQNPHSKIKLKNLSGLNLGGYNLGEADFSEFDLSAAHFNGSDLKNAKFSNANLKAADFTSAWNLNVAGLKAARNWLLASYSPGILNALNLPRNYNRRLSTHDLSGYELERANLEHGDFRDVSLKGAHLQKALLN